MKIKSTATDNVYLLPLKYQTNILVTSDYKKDLIDCLENYFTNKKKNKAIIKDEEDEVITIKEFNFIYIPFEKNIESNFVFKGKTLMNSEVSEIISENQEYFQSIEMIRTGFYELLTDKGLFTLRKILSRGLDNTIDVELENFDITSILQMFSIDTEQLSEPEKYIILYNLLLYTNRSENNIVYIDFPIDDKTLSWINSNTNEKNYFFLDNESLTLSNIENVPIIKLSNKEFLETVKINQKDIHCLTYIFHSFFSRNLIYQTQKNIELYRLFEDKNSTFLIIPEDTKAQNLA